MTRPLLAFFVALCLTAHSSARPTPNIIIYLADDMGAGDTSAFQDWSGNADATQIHTPNMERLAARGIKFTDAHSPSSRCTATRYALLTGRYPWRTHLKAWVLFGVQCDPLIERERVTLPEFLRNQGYRTGMVGKWHLGLTYTKSDGSPATGWDDADLTKPVFDGPMNHGFDFFHGTSRSHPTSGPDGDRRNTPDQTIGPGWMHGANITGATGDGKKLDGSYVLNEIGPALHQQAFSFLKADSESPFFLYFASPANHTPHTPCDAIDGKPVAGASKFKNGKATSSKRLDFIYENDVQLGLLLDWLDTTEDPRRPGNKLADNTLVVFASDNGAESSAKTATGPVRSNKGSTYEGGNRIPFIASWPAGGIGGSKTSNHLLGLNDLYATIGEILGKAPADGSAEDSISALSALRDEAKQPRPALFPNDHKQAGGRKKAAKRDPRAWIAVRSNATPVAGSWKLFLDHRFAYDGELHPQELYELASDPKEATNRRDDPSAKAALDFLLQQAKKAAGDLGRTR